MSENRSRFVLLCQQALACAVVVAVAAPATGVVDLDIVAPRTPAADRHLTAEGGALVASAPVEPTVREIPIGGGNSGHTQRPATSGGAQRVALMSSTTDESTPQPPTPPVEKPDKVVTPAESVNGFATVGVTWDSADPIEDDEIALKVRSFDDGEWSKWEELPYHAEHGPDPTSAEATHSRLGTDALVLGDVEDVQVKVVTGEAEMPDDMRLSIVDPGESTAPVHEEPAIDTATLSSASTDASTTDEAGTAVVAGDVAEPADGTEVTDPVGDAELIGTPADVTPKPRIFSRAQWGADERMRDKGSLRYYEVHAGFVHHTVNANGYTKSQVPSIIRGIYAYHTQSRGWSDIGYNFLVDRFGRIWEGRAGGVDRPVVGAHTLNYNEYAFAMSAIGNYETAQPSNKMLNAYARLFAWKLSLHGINAGSMRQRVGKKWLPAINGHRDVGQTACPGRYLYAKIPTIRARTVAAQRPFTSRGRDADLAGSRWPDLVVRDKATKAPFIVKTGGQVNFTKARATGQEWRSTDLTAGTPDLTGDGKPDVLGRDSASKATGIFPGDGAGHFGAPVRTIGRFKDVDQLTGVGDLDGDGHNDVIGRDSASKQLILFPGEGKAKFGPSKVLSPDWSRFNLTLGAGEFNGDRHPDLIARDKGGKLWLFPGRGRPALGDPVQLPRSWSGYDLLAAPGDVTGDGIPDLVGRVRSNKKGWIYPGDGSGSITTRLGPFTRFVNTDILVGGGKATGTGSNDLLGRNKGGRLVVFPNRGTTNIEGIVAASGNPFRGTNAILNVGDWNGDGESDVMTRKFNGNLMLRAGNGHGGFDKPVLAGKGFGSVKLLTAVGDMTGDGYPDLMGAPGGKAMRIYPSNGSSGFKASYVAHRAISATVQIGGGLWDVDGSPDSLVRRSDGKVFLFPGNGPGGLTSGRQVGGRANKYDWFAGVGDADGDGKPDLIARTPKNGRLWLLPGDGKGGFDKRRFIGDGMERFDLGD